MPVPIDTNAKTSEVTVHAYNLESCADEPVARAIDVFYKACRMLADEMTELQYLDFLKCIKGILEE